ncbi:MAG: class I SAM-dependent methyltransferase family protein [Candidatus Woesearchaeota archaeon]|nr:class I SAM-dependent methyltransferase family protein [Candidatus Woesearchaeota archaeon]
MLSLKVPLKNAESVKKQLMKKELLDYGFKPKKEGAYLYFPIKNSVKIKSAELVEETFEKKEKQSYIANLPREIKEKLPSSFDIIGDIIIIDITKDIEKYEKEIAASLLETHKSVKTILKKSGIHEGEFRTQKLIYLAGEEKKETIYKENDIQLKLDVEKVYFSPRLSSERKRIYQKVRKGENILVMFSGCGPYVFTISKNTEAKHILGIEKNPVAHEYALGNIVLNKAKNVELVNADVREYLPKLKERYDRVIMPLPKEAELFLMDAFKVVKKGTVVHLYGFEHEDEFYKAEEKLASEAKKAGIKYRLLEFIKCGNYSPGKFRVCLDFKIL